MNLPEPGNTISGRYQIHALIGKGGMATVYSALDTETGKEVALKFLNPEQVRVSRRRDRFIREFAILSRLDHPSVVRVLELNENGSDAPFFSMELIKGRTLTAKIKEATDAKVITKDSYTFVSLILLRDLAKALHYLHLNGVIYCDLKPDNIIVPESGDGEAILKLVDFGIAVDRDEPITGNSPNMIGTSYYMSPEQIRSEVLSVRSDIYSFGVVAFELLTGNVPFASDALFTVTASHLIGKVPLAHSVNHAVPSVIDRMIQICMEKSAGDRYDSMEEVVGRLEAVTAKTGDNSILKRISQFFKFKKT